MASIDFDALWNYADPATTEATFRALLAEHAGAPAAWRHELETQLARTLSLQRRFDEGHALLDALEPQLGDAPRPRVRLALERGRLFNSARRRDEARPCFAHALALADDAGLDALAIDAAHMLAIVAEPEEAMRWNLEAVRRAEASDDPAARRWLASLYNNLGWTCHDAGDSAAALDWLEKALAERRKSGQEPALRIARWSVARMLRACGQVLDALGEQQALLETYGADGVDGYVFEELAECLLALERADEAAPHFARAHRCLAGDPWLAEHEPERLERLARLGRGT